MIQPICSVLYGLSVVADLSSDVTSRLMTIYNNKEFLSRRHSGRLYLKMSNSNILQLLDFGNPVFSSYIFWSFILLLKTPLMRVFTTYYRSKKKLNEFMCELLQYLFIKWKKNLLIQAHISAEDVVFVKNFDSAERKVNRTDNDVERIRRCDPFDIQFNFSSKINSIFIQCPFEWFGEHHSISIRCIFLSAHTPIGDTGTKIDSSGRHITNCTHNCLHNCHHTAAGQRHFVGLNIV